MTSIAICKPNGQTVQYEPFIDHLMATEARFLGSEDVIEESAYIGYGKGGLYFDQPGNYRLRAIYHAADGSQVRSNVVSVRVRYPVTAKQEELAELLTGDEQGALFWLLGSDSESLASGNAAFDEVLEKHADEPLADYVRLARGVNLSRTFAIIDDRQPSRIQLREPALGEAQSLLSAATGPSSRVDDLSQLMGLQRLADAQQQMGDTQAANETSTRERNLRSRRR